MIFEEEYNNHLEFGEGIIVDPKTKKIALIIGDDKYDLELNSKWLEKMCYKYFGENNYIDVIIVNKNKLYLYDRYTHKDHRLDIK